MSQNKIVGILGMLITLIYGVSTITAAYGGATFISSTKVFPMIITIFSLILSIIIFFQDSFGKEAHKKLVLDMRVVKAIGKCTAIFVVYALIFEHVGYILSTIFMLISLLTIINKGKMKLNIAISVMFSITAYFVFAKLLSISLPPGIIPL